MADGIHEDVSHESRRHSARRSSSSCTTAPTSPTCSGREGEVEKRDVDVICETIRVTIIYEHDGFRRGRVSSSAAGKIRSASRWLRGRSRAAR